MVDKFIRIAVCICIFFAGNNVFASTLKNVELQSLKSNTGKIILDTEKTSVTKKIISDNEILIKLKNTNLSDNIRTNFINIPKDTDVQFIQKNKDTFIYLLGMNIANYEMLYENDGSVIPYKNHKKDLGITFVIALITGLLTILSVKINNFQKKYTENSYLQNRKALTDPKAQQIKITEQFNTLRNQSNIKNENEIHGEPMFAFSKNSKIYITSPVTEKTHNVKNLKHIEELKKAVNS